MSGSGSTTRRGIPYPLNSDTPDIATFIQDVAEATDLDAYVIEDVLADRPAAGELGRFFHATDTGHLSFDTGSTWVNVPVGTYLALTGGTLSGALNLADQQLRRPELRDYAETCSVIAASGAARTLDLETANAFDVTLDNNCTFTFSNPPASGKLGSLYLILRQPGTLRAVTWPAAVDWPSGTPPTMAINTVNDFSFTTTDGGTTWLGHVGGLAFA